MKKLIGTLAAVAALGLAAGAQAQGDINSGAGGSPSPGNIGGAGNTGGAGSPYGGTATGTNEPKGEQQLEGKVLKADRTSITIEHMGAAIPLQVQSSTSFQGVKSAKDIKEGSQVRASFSLKGSRNELTSIEVMPGAGGTGSQKGYEKGGGGTKGGY